jgi:hypothetical protein
VLIIGNSIGTSSAMVQLIRTLTKQREAIAERIVGALTADLEALTDQQLLARAREFYAQQDHRATQAS